MVDGGRESERARLGSVLELRIPADAGGSVRLAVLRMRASELSDAIGGGLSEDALIGDVQPLVAGYVAVPAHAGSVAPEGIARERRTAQRYLHSAVLAMDATSGGPCGGRG
jgi:hypothetical protein